MCEKGWKRVKLGEMWKKHQIMLSNNDDAQSITQYGFLVWPHAQLVALRAHCTPPPLHERPPRLNDGVAGWALNRRERALSDGARVNRHWRVMGKYEIPVAFGAC